MCLIYRDGRPYLYRAVRRGGRVTSEYLASGRSALLIAALEADDWDRQSFDRQEARSERRQCDDLERALDELAERARDVAREALSAAGYRQHHRGDWRKRRVSRNREGEPNRTGDGQMGGRQADRMGRGKDGKAKTALREELADVATQLAGSSPSPSERVLGLIPVVTVLRPRGRGRR
jgi:hypothetical protein